MVYFVFELQAGTEPVLLGAGITVDDAEAILGDGAITTMLGEMQFVSFPPPP